MRRFGMILRRFIFFLIFLVLVGGVGWGVWHWRANGGDQVRFRTEKVQRGRVVSLINASGTVVPEEVIDIGAQVAGKIDRFNKDLDTTGKSIDYGSRVEKGLILAWIDDSMYRPEVGIARAELEVAKADVDKAKADLEAAKAKSTQAGQDLARARRTGSSMSQLELDALYAANITAKAAVPAAEATLLRADKNVRRAEQVLKRAETNLKYTEIISPVDGVIIDRRVNIGQTVVASLNAPSLFLIAKDLKKMQVWASVNEADIGRITVGQTAYFKVDAYPREVFTGTVDQIRLNAMNTQNVVTYTVVVKTDNSNLKLLPYLTANLQFHVEHREGVLTVPNTALRYRPAVERVDPEHRDWYLETRRRRPANNEIKPGSASALPEGVVWAQDEEGQLQPIRVRLGLTDGVVTEVVEILDGELNEGTAIVTGEVQAQSSDGNKNPFAVNMWGGKKKKEE
jgi:HlyD family secretion protein